MFNSIDFSLPPPQALGFAPYIENTAAAHGPWAVTAHALPVYKFKSVALTVCENISERCVISKLGHVTQSSPTYGAICNL